MAFSSCRASLSSHFPVIPGKNSQINSNPNLIVLASSSSSSKKSTNIIYDNDLVINSNYRLKHLRLPSTGQPILTTESDDDIHHEQHARKLKVFKHILGQVGEDPSEGLAMIDAVQRTGEDHLLDEALDITAKFLNEYYSKMMDLDDDDNYYQARVIVGNTLKYPHHKSLPRFVAKNLFLSNYQGENGWIHVLQELAKIDYNVVQSLHQKEVAQVSKWDHAASEKLPDYLRICFKALDDITNEISYKVFKEHGYNPVHSLRRAWASLCNAFLVEAKWFDSGHLPKAEEYLKNGIVSSGVHVVLVHIFFLLGQNLTSKNVDLIENNPGLISSTATILRLWDDLGSAKDENQEGKDGSYIYYYMKEHQDSTAEDARKHAIGKISDAWKGLNKECLSPNPFSTSFTRASLNLARMVPLMYGYDDNQRLPILEQYIKSLLHESTDLPGVY
ncbi:hypothetical protein QYF36_002216 [Acer negundo]|nr:hypothetical protein QYF36_002216 [Acer negundo]